jgi:C4-dicarboxylate-specific signal transduction histidine kinase
MDDSTIKFEAVEQLVNELRQQHSSNPKKVEQVLTGILELVRDVEAHPQPEQGLSGSPADLERRIEERTAALRQANATLQGQIAERETVEIMLRKANKDLEMQLRV